jgi:hypothetical protein
MGFRYADLASENLKEGRTTRSDSTVGVEHSIVNCEKRAKNGFLSSKIAPVGESHAFV